MNLVLLCRINSFRFDINKQKKEEKNLTINHIFCFNFRFRFIYVFKSSMYLE